MNALRLRLKQERIAVAQDGLLLHQKETSEAFRGSQVVMNCAPTGAGKTKAAHLAIKKHAADCSVLFIAPTNALVGQHLEDAKAFVKTNGLPHKVVAVDGSVLYSLLKKCPGIYRAGDVLHQLIFNPRAFLDELGVDGRYGPIFLIINPDQVWYAIIKGREKDTRNLLVDFINSFRFVVVDEFHYYDAQQLVLFFLCVAFWKHFGQFQDGLKLLLLTATPDEMVQEFFIRLDLAPAIVGLGQDEFAKTIPVLAPVELTLTSEDLSDYTAFAASRYKEGNDGVIISDSLREINMLYRRLLDMKIPVGRITGPISNRDRKLESQQPIILATPTVDLGFNFPKPKVKNRQEIDFVVARAKDKSAFWQRLGRAGRVLGKQITEKPSEAVMLLSDSAKYRDVKNLDGKEVTRTELKGLLGLRDRRLCAAALTREGLYTATRQLLEVERMVKGVNDEVVDGVFESLKKCMDPTGTSPSWQSFRKRHWLMGSLLELEKKHETPTPKKIRELPSFGTLKQLGDKHTVLLSAWAKDHFYKRGQLNQYLSCTNEQKEELINTLLRQPDSKGKICNYHREQILRMEYLFDFRGGKQANRVWVYDREGLHSPALIKQIDLVSLLAHYEFDVVRDRKAAQQRWGVRLPPRTFFFEILDFLQYPYTPVYFCQDTLPEPPEKKEGESDHPEVLPFFWRTIALHGLSLDFVNKKKGSLAVPLEIKPLLKDISELFFITPIENRYALLNMLADYDISTATLKAKNQSGREVEYHVVVGKDAISISEELYFRVR
jgi:CRISPR-associated helicase Cas3